MQFLIIVIHFALMGLTGWWTYRGWDKGSTLSQRLDTAGGKFGLGLVASYFVPFLLLSGFGPLSPEAYDFLSIGGLAFAAVAFVFFVAARVCKTREGILSRKAQRLSGHLVPPKLWPAWGVAVVTGVVMFLVVFTAILAFAVLSTYIDALNGLTNSSSSMFQTASQGVAVGTCIIWIVIVALMYLIQKSTIYFAERDYRELSAGIENRLSQQREELLAVRDADSTTEQK